MSTLHFRIMANNVQREIINSLKKGRMTTSQLAKEVGKISPYGIDKLTIYLHAWLLEQKGILRSEGEGMERTYTLTDKWKEIEAEATKKS